VNVLVGDDDGQVMTLLVLRVQGGHEVERHTLVTLRAPHKVDN
jgi:hypothetical protein